MQNQITEALFIKEKKEFIDKVHEISKKYHFPVELYGSLNDLLGSAESDVKNIKVYVSPTYQDCEIHNGKMYNAFLALGDAIRPFLIGNCNFNIHFLVDYYIDCFIKIRGIIKCGICNERKSVSGKCNKCNFLLCKDCFRKKMKNNVMKCPNCRIDLFTIL